MNKKIKRNSQLTDSGVSPELEAKLLRRAKGPFLPAMTGDEMMVYFNNLLNRRREK